MCAMIHLVQETAPVAKSPILLLEGQEERKKPLKVKEGTALDDWLREREPKTEADCGSSNVPQAVQRRLAEDEDNTMKNKGHIKNKLQRKYAAYSQMYQMR